MSIAVTDFLTAAMAEIRMARAGDVLDPDSLALALTLFNELLDRINVTDRALYNVDFTTFTLTPNHQPHTIGVAANTPDFTVTIGRPEKILAGNVILPNNIRVPCTLLNDQQWNSIPAGAAAGQAITITVSTPPVLYYSPGWPNGSIFLWPVPSIAYGLELETQTLLASVTATDTLDLPFGYQEALRLTLAEKLASPFGQTVSADTRRNAAEARAAAWGSNDVVPDLVTRDGGMPSGQLGSTRSDWNWLTGRVGSSY